MSQNDNEKFCESYRTINDEHMEEDSYEKAMKVLLSGNMLYNKSIEEGHKESEAVRILEKTANDYRKIVDGKKVNNYAQEFMEFQKKIAIKLYPGSIESGLTNADEFIKNLQCKGEYETCKHNEVTKTDLLQLFKPKPANPEENPNRRVLESSCSDPLLTDSEPFDELFREVNSQESLQPKVPFRRFDYVLPSNSNNFKPNKQLSATNNVFLQSNNKNTEFSPAQIKQSMENIGNALFGKSKKNNPPEASGFADKTEKRNEVKEPQDEEPNKYPDFRCSREVLANQMKLSSNSNPNTSNAKKFLGGKRYPVNKPFTTPFATENDGRQTAAGKPEIENERLKNIDPKMVELIRNEIMEKCSPIYWDDIAGLNYAKRSIQEAVVLPILRPDIFTGLRKPPKGILLFGPPGTGKTLIGKCIASQSKSTFFSISASSLTSKWIGEGEKMVRALFAVACLEQPSVVFIDEIDSLLCQRSESEHESSRRLKTEFLIQLDGAATKDDDLVLIVAATNRPQELDEAARRRFTKRLYIPLPELEARSKIVQNLLEKERHTLNDKEMLEIAKLTEGYSGADMKVLCSEAALMPIRQIASQISSIQANDVRPMSFNDFNEALKTMRASVSPEDLGQYEKWDKTYGSGQK